MEPKGFSKRKGSSLATLATTEIKTNINTQRSLEPVEENALRMRHGIGAPLQALLPKACGDNEEVADELLLIEMQLFRAARLQLSPKLAQPPQPSFAQRSPQKSKIISALRAKK
ncbi:MAG: hypothetical protein FWG75_08915 [Cystobacterineae bacterium]|nr:hypothetical protein [Cystobacterineae bacterium]